MNCTVAVFGASCTSPAFIAEQAPDSRSTWVPAQFADPTDDRVISCAYAGVANRRAAATRRASDCRQSNEHTTRASPAAAPAGDDTPRATPTTTTVEEVVTAAGPELDEGTAARGTVVEVDETTSELAGLAGVCSAAVQPATAPAAITAVVRIGRVLTLRPVSLE